MRCGDFRTSYSADMAILDSTFARVALVVVIAALAGRSVMTDIV